MSVPSYLDYRYGRLTASPGKLELGDFGGSSRNVQAMTFGVAQLMHKDEQGGYGLLLQLHAYV